MLYFIFLLWYESSESEVVPELLDRLFHIKHNSNHFAQLQGNFTFFAKSYFLCSRHSMTSTLWTTPKFIFLKSCSLLNRRGMCEGESKSTNLFPEVRKGERNLQNLFFLLQEKLKKLISVAKIKERFCRAKINQVGT